MTKVISVVSGKGGSGKSLLTAVVGRALAREGQRVLLVDLDIFVRGLTVLLFSFRRPDEAPGQHSVSSLLGVFKEHSQRLQPAIAKLDGLLIQRFLECDLLPAVANINTPLDYDDQSLSDEEFCVQALRSLMGVVSGRYDYILIDNRAGMDSLVSASCRVSDIVLSIAEDDEVGRQTNVNLIRFLQNKGIAKSVYSIINKGRGIASYNDVETRFGQRSDFGVLGVVPFDIEILDGFGRERFWSSITGTLYFRAVIRAWNELTKLERVEPISFEKYSFAPAIFMTEAQGRYSLIERMLRIYSILFIIAGVGYWIYWRFRNELSYQEVTAAALILVGLMSFVISTSGFQQFLRVRERKFEIRDS